MEDEKPSQPSSGSSDTGLDPKVSALLAYLLGIVGGIVFYAISKDSYVKFHAMQSILLSVAMAIIWAIFFAVSFAIFYLAFITWIVYLGIAAVWILMMIKAYQGEKYKLPIIGDMAEKYSS